MTTALILVVFPFAMAFAAFSDLVSMTIPNRVPLVLLAVFPFVAALLGLPLSQVGAHFGVGLLCLCVTFGFFAVGWMGGGDAKLMAATAVWFGPSEALVAYLAYGTILGGFVTLGLLYARAQMAPATGIDFVDRLLERDTGIPYGIALGFAGLAAYSASPWMIIALASP